MWVSKGMMGALKGDGPNPQARRLFFVLGLISFDMLQFILLQNLHISGNYARNNLFFFPLVSTALRFVRPRGFWILHVDRSSRITTLMALFEAAVNIVGKG